MLILWPPFRRLSALMLNWNEYRLFYRQFRQRFHDTGAVLPSGRSLSRKLASAVAIPSDSAAGPSDARGRRILEIGPGTGAVTQYIVGHLLPSDRLDVVEINEHFAQMLERRFAEEPVWSRVRQQATVHNIGIERLATDEGYDVIVSSLPLNNFSAEFVREVLDKYAALARPGARVTFFEYIAVRNVRRLLARADEKTRLSEIGEAIHAFLARGRADRTAILRNVPPAWVHHVRLD